MNKILKNVQRSQDILQFAIEIHYTIARDYQQTLSLLILHIKRQK